MTGLWLDEAHSDIATKAGYVDRYRAVWETGVLSWRRGWPKLVIRQDFKILENLLVPLAADGQQADMPMAFAVMYPPCSKLISP